jgi:dipeptidase D
MGRILYELGKEIPYSLVTLEGGSKDNAITRQCAAEIIVDKEDVADTERILSELEATLKAEYATTDPDLKVAVSNSNMNKEVKAIHPMDQEKMITLMMMLPYGVQHMSADLPGLVETSLNMGVIELRKNNFQIRMSLRSSVRSRKLALQDKLVCICEYLGADYNFHQDYPEWQFKKESVLRETAVAVYKELFGKEMKVDAMHAGLECGILLDKKPDMDIISIGPDILDIHTPQERLDIASTQRTYQFLLKLLETLRK